MTTKESFIEQLSRVHEMSEDTGDTWDLSVNDQLALTALLMSHLDLLKALRSVTEMLANQRDYQLGNAYPEEYAAVENALATIAKAEGR